LPLPGLQHVYESTNANNAPPSPTPPMPTVIRVE
jgi:hypothetical protein